MILLSAEWESLFLFGALSAIALSIASKRSFFLLPEQKGRWVVPLRWIEVLSAFALYFSIAMFFAPLALRLLRVSLLAKTSFVALASGANFLTSLTIFAALVWYSLCSIKMRPIAARIWARERPRSLRKDLKMAFLCWLLSLPLLLFAGPFFDLLLSFVFHVKEVPEQVAITFFKMTIGHPLYFSLGLTTILLLAPCVEETLFRGFLQSFIRQHLGSKQAILITSLCFACFHYSPEQGLGNIPVIGSLFLFALFLGFAYEKQGCLLTSIALHASFNGLSVLNLCLFGEMF